MDSLSPSLYALINTKRVYEDAQMPQSRKPTAQDIYNAEQIARAASFTASIFAYGRHNTVPCPTLEAARAMADRMTAAVKNGRMGIVYAITPEGTAIMVPKEHALAA